MDVERLEAWEGQDVIDASEEKLGKLDHVYYKVGSDQPLLASLKSGLLGRRSRIVPLAGSQAGRDYIRLGYTAAQIEAADVDVELGETLDGASARRVAEAYGLEFAAEADLESATLIKRRREQAREARKQAEELEEQARRRDVEAEDARAGAVEAQREAEARAEDSHAAHAAAERARAEAQRIERGA